ncbi:hypothetical protein H4S02_010853, partial [Coemansia sp. RSA 2611]
FWACCYSSCCCCCCETLRYHCDCFPARHYGPVDHSCCGFPPNDSRPDFDCYSHARRCCCHAHDAQCHHSICCPGCCHNTFGQQDYPSEGPCPAPSFTACCPSHCCCCYHPCCPHNHLQASHDYRCQACG